MTKKKLKIARNYAVIYFGKCFLFFFVDTDARNFEQNFENYHTFRYTRFMPKTAKKIRILSDSIILGQIWAFFEKKSVISFFCDIFFFLDGCTSQNLVLGKKKRYHEKSDDISAI